MNGVRDQLLEQVTFLVEMAPHQGRLTSVANHVGHLLTALLDGALLLGPLFPQVGGRHGEQHSLGDGAGLNQVVDLVQRRQDEPAIVEAKI